VVNFAKQDGQAIETLDVHQKKFGDVAASAIRSP
jgi:hypothetical protein